VEIVNSQVTRKMLTEGVDSVIQYYRNVSLHVIIDNLLCCFSSLHFLNQACAQSQPSASYGRVPGLNCFPKVYVYVCKYICLSFCTHVIKTVYTIASLYRLQRVCTMLPGR